MAGDYHGWDKEQDHWRFADTIGRPQNESVFVIHDFGKETSPREALSAIMSAMAQFQGRIQVLQTECNTRLVNKLKEASLLKVAQIKVGQEYQWGVLGVKAKNTPKAQAWWKFW